MELFDSLSVEANVSLGYEAHFAATNPLRHLVATQQELSVTRGRAAAAISACGLTDVRDVPVGSLSTGHRRLTELARCLAGPFDMLLLDEPSSGLDKVETERFGQVLLDAVAQRGVGVLLIEHDLALIKQVCDYVHVLDFGKHIFSGTVEEMSQSSVVRGAYLGDAELVTSNVDEVGAQR
jgi:ABC-type branched-subunit amino acid transport system ATPase component